MGVIKEIIHEESMALHVFTVAREVFMGKLGPKSWRKGSKHNPQPTKLVLIVGLPAGKKLKLEKPEVVQGTKDPVVGSLSCLMLGEDTSVGFGSDSVGHLPAEQC